MLRTRSPLSHPRIATLLFSLDLHVLTTPPAFTLSQNQTLRIIFFNFYFKLNVCLFSTSRSDISLYPDSLDFTLKSLPKIFSISGRFAQSYLVNFKELPLLPSLPSHLPARLSQCRHTLSYDPLPSLPPLGGRKEPPIRKLLLSFVKRIFELFLFFQKFFISSL